jgi:hypothetical protein
VIHEWPLKPLTVGSIKDAALASFVQLASVTCARPTKTVNDSFTNATHQL